MAGGKSKPSAQVAKHKRVEYTLFRGKQPVFSHASQGVVEARRNTHHASDHANGSEHEYSIVERTVAYKLPEGATEIPTGDDSHNLQGEVSERKV